MSARRDDPAPAIGAETPGAFSSSNESGSAESGANWAW